jgi:predicted nucleic-acid-binding Zn-ribbon protein
MKKIVCKKCGNDGAFKMHIEYDAFAVISCAKCGFMGILRTPIEQTADFEIKEVPE